MAKTLTEKWYALPKNWEDDVKQLLSDAKQLYAKEERLRKQQLSSGISLMRERNYVYNRASAKEDKAKLLTELKLSNRQYNFLKKNYMMMGKQTEVERIYGATTRTYIVEIPNGVYEVQKISAYGMRGSPTDISIRKVK